MLCLLPVFFSGFPVLQEYQMHNRHGLMLSVFLHIPYKVLFFPIVCMVHRVPLYGLLRQIQSRSSSATQEHSLQPLVQIFSGRCLHSQYHFASMLFGKQVIIQGCSYSSDMERTSWGRGKSYTYFFLTHCILFGGKDKKKWYRNLAYPNTTYMFK